MPGHDQTPLDRVRFLARADSRVHILERLHADGPATQRELRAAIDASRTTVSRSLSALVDEDWVTCEGATYRLTHAGRVVAEEFTGLLDTMARVDDVAPVLRWLPPGLETPAFQDAADLTVVTPTDADPYAPARAQTEILRTADRLRVLLPATDRDSTEVLVEEVTERGLVVESVVTEDVEATLESESFAGLMRETLETGRSTIYVTADALPCYLGLADDGRVQVGVADDDGFPRALVTTSDDDVREWAESLYDRYRSGARQKPTSDF